MPEKFSTPFICDKRVNRLRIVFCGFAESGDCLLFKKEISVIFSSGTKER